jgi:hypothetical protein
MSSFQSTFATALALLGHVLGFLRPLHDAAKLAALNKYFSDLMITNPWTRTRTGTPHRIVEIAVHHGLEYELLHAATNINPTTFFALMNTWETQAAAAGGRILHVLSGKRTPAESD